MYNMQGGMYTYQQNKAAPAGAVNTNERLTELHPLPGARLMPESTPSPDSSPYYPTNTDCPFCEIMAGFPTSRTAIIEPLNPVVPGHMIAITREHVPDAGYNPTITADLMEDASWFASRMKCDYNIITSAGAAATQTVFHLHIHIVPRYPDDGLTLPWTGQKAVER